MDKKKLFLKKQKKIAEKQSENNIIIRGIVISKEQIFKLWAYFQEVSGGNDTITIKEFQENFGSNKGSGDKLQLKSIKTVIGSVFTFLDGKEKKKNEVKMLRTQQWKAKQKAKWFKKVSKKRIQLKNDKKQ